MAVEHLPAIGGNNLAGLLAATEKLVAAGRSGAPTAFVAALFERAVAEDLVRYRPAEFSALAEAAWGFLAEAPPCRTRCGRGRRAAQADFGAGDRQ